MGFQNSVLSNCVKSLPYPSDSVAKCLRKAVIAIFISIVIVR